PFFLVRCTSARSESPSVLASAFPLRPPAVGLQITTVFIAAFLRLIVDLGSREKFIFSFSHFAPSCSPKKFPNAYGRFIPRHPSAILERRVSSLGRPGRVFERRSGKRIRFRRAL